MGPRQLCPGFSRMVSWPWLFVGNDVKLYPDSDLYLTGLFAKQEVFRLSAKIWLGVNGGVSHLGEC